MLKNVSRDDLELNEQVYYCPTTNSFRSAWTDWDTQDCISYQEITPDEIVFGVIRDGLFHYVKCCYE